MATKKMKPTAASVPAPPQTVTVGEVSPGDCFYYQGHKFRVASIGAEAANVILLEAVKVQVAPRKYANGDKGVARMEMDKEIAVEKA